VSEAVKEIWQHDERTLAILWTDQKEDHFDVVALRQHCPCAVCVDEHTGKRNMELTRRIPDSVRPLRVHSVGQYALTMEFSDGHKTGIYTFAYLRGLTQEASSN
jgi:DUF971 family protein